MKISKKRELAIKAVIIVFYTLLFLLLAVVLIWYGKIRFKWSDQFLLEYRYDKNKSKERKILILGDSQLEKWPMRHCLYKDMQRFCRRNNIGYVNAAHHGFGPIEHKDRLDYIAGDYKPNLIILFSYVGNDLTDVMLGNNEAPMQPTYDVIYKEGESEVPKENKQTDYTFDWEKFEKMGMDSTIIAYAKQKAINPHLLVLAVWHPDYLLDNILISSNESKYTWYKSLQKYEEILILAEAINSEICIVAIPSTVQIDTSHYDFYRKITFNVSNDLMHSNEPQRLLNDFAKASGIYYLDLLPYFKNDPNTAELYFENDDHLSESGHQLAFKHVKEQILMPFAERTENYVRKEREHNFYKNYKDWVIEYTMEEIRGDSSWFNEVKKKAEAKSIGIDSMLYLDANYLLEKSWEEEEIE